MTISASIRMPAFRQNAKISSMPSKFCLIPPFQTSKLSLAPNQNMPFQMGNKPEDFFLPIMVCSKVPFYVVVEGEAEEINFLMLKLDQRVLFL